MPRAETYVAKIERELIERLRAKGVAVDTYSVSMALRELVVLAPLFIVQVAARERRLLRVLEALRKK